MRAALGRFVCGVAVPICLAAVATAQTTNQSKAPIRQRAARQQEAELQAQPLPVPLDLIKEGTVDFSVSSPSVVEVGARCDADGNMYAVWSDAPPIIEQVGGQSVANSPSTMAEPVRKLLVDSKKIVAYRTTSIPDYPSQTRLSFAVSRDGTVSVLVVANHERFPKSRAEDDYFVEKFGEDGDSDSHVKLEMPEGEYLNPSSFAVFADGRFLVMGEVRSNPMSEKQTPFAGVFDSSGRFLNRIHFAVDQKAKYPGIMGEGAEKNGSESDAGAFLAVALSSASSDPDGDLYIKLAGSPVQVIAVSPSGEVERQIKLDIPAAGLTSAESGSYRPGFMYVHFYPVMSTGSTASEPTGMIGIINIVTGQYDRLYRLPPNAEQRITGVCGDSKGNFLFLESNPENKLKIVKYAAR